MIENSLQKLLIFDLLSISLRDIITKSSIIENNFHITVRDNVL